MYVNSLAGGFVTVPPAFRINVIVIYDAANGLTINRPKTTENSEKRRFPRSVSSDDEQMLSRLDVERKRLDQNISVRRDDRYFVEDDVVVRMNDLSPSLQDYSRTPISIRANEGGKADGPLACSSVPAELTSFLTNFPSLISAIVSSSSETR